MSSALALVVGGLFVACVVGLSLGWSGVDARRRNLLVAVGVAAVAFQIFHFAEHLIQVAAWVQNPRVAYLTPWAAGAGEGLIEWCVLGDPSLSGGADALRRACGIELLHLFGNSIFWLGLLAASRRMRYADGATAGAIAVQGFHVAEHVLLTGSTFLWSRPLGVSTYFGLLEPSAFTLATRVWFHFGINLVATVLAVIAIRNGRRKSHIAWDLRTGAVELPAWV